MDFNKFFTDDDIFCMDNYYHVFMYFYNKLRPHFLDEKAASIAADLAVGFLNDYDLDSDV